MIALRRACFTLGLASSLLTPFSVAATAQEIPVVIALDSSRSLSAAESRATVALAQELLAGVPTAGTLAFADAVRWLARPGAAGGAEALDALTPNGRFTLLNDSLIEGARAMTEGGVLVLLSDGKDENSATTIEDAARLASDRGVRLVTVGAGRADERTLRRLALLTGGLYAGRVGAVDGATILQEIASLRSDVVAEQAARRPAVQAPQAPPPPSDPGEGTAGEVTTPTAGAGAGANSGSPSGWPSATWLLAVGAALAALGIVLGFLLARRRSPSAGPEAGELERGTQPGVQWPDSMPSPGGGTQVPAAATAAAAPAPLSAPRAMNEVEIARVRLRPAVRPQGLLEISLDETAEFQRLPFSDSIERTLVLTAEVVLTVREPGREPRSYRLPPERAVDVGRDATANTLAFQDPTMSTQHLRIALDNDEVFLVDLGSTNGVLVGERRIDAVHLHPGDRFRAGMIEFELGLHHGSMS